MKTKRENKPRDYDARTTQEIVIRKPLTDMPICVSNVPAQLPDKAQPVKERPAP